MMIMASLATIGRALVVAVQPVVKVTSDACVDVTFLDVVLINLKRMFNCATKNLVKVSEG